MSAAATAASVSVFVATGAFGAMSAAIGIILLALVFAFAFDCIIKPKERLAYSFVVGLLLLMTFAPVYEFYVFYNLHSYLDAGFSWYVKGIDQLQQSSTVSFWLFIAWFVLGVTSYILFSIYVRFGKRVSEVNISNKTEKIGILLTVIWGMLLVSLVVFKWDDLVKMTLNECGDFLAGAMAPVAFLWLIVGYSLQRYELRQNTAALVEQSKFLEASARAAKVQSTMSIIKP
ncbi:LTA synthase family protein [Vibrio panuliri]|nr:hypothetical protein [Vibrio panuliri]